MKFFFNVVILACVAQCHSDFLDYPGADGNTSTPFPNTSTTPAAQSLPEVNATLTYANGSACVVLQAALAVSVVYDNTSIGYVTVPADASVSGQCASNASSQDLWLRFNVNDSNTTWALHFVFSKDSGASISVSEVSLTYNTAVFGASAPATDSVSVRGRQLTSEADTYYRCDANSTLLHTAGVALTASRLRYQAFIQAGDVPMAGEFEQCSADAGFSIDLALGLILVGLMLLTFSALGIHYKRCHRTSYEVI